MWRLRFARSRGLAQKAIQTQSIRLNGRRIERVSTLVRADDVVTMLREDAAVALRIIALPARRGAAIEVQNCYEVLA